MDPVATLRGKTTLSTRASRNIGRGSALDFDVEGVDRVLRAQVTQHHFSGLT
jgi:hypothetical protein